MLLGLQIQNQVLSAAAKIGASLGPGAPTNLTATGGVGEIVLSWTASAGATGYNVKRSAVSGGPYILVGTPAGTSFTDTTVTDGVTYFYVVSATNMLGESPNSAEASAASVAPVAWTPTTSNATWEDNTGTYTTDYPTFLASANLPEVKSLKFGAVSITSLTNVSNMPKLATLWLTATVLPGAYTLDVSTSPKLASLKVTSTAAFNLLATDCPELAGTIALNSSGSGVQKFDISNSPQVVNFTGGKNMKELIAQNCTAFAQNINFVSGSGDLYTTIDLRNCPNVTWTEINNLPSLTYLNVTGCSFTSLIVLDCPLLQGIVGVDTLTAVAYIQIQNCDLLSFDASGLITLLELELQGNTNLTSLDVTGCTALTLLRPASTGLSSITGLSGCTALTVFDIASTAFTGTLTISTLTNLVTVDCSYTTVDNIDLDSNTALVSFTATYTDLTDLDFSVGPTTALQDINVDGLYLTSLDVTNCTSLLSISAQSNTGLSSITGLTDTSSSLIALAIADTGFTGSQDFSMLSTLENLYIGGTSVTFVDVGNLAQFYGFYATLCTSLTAVDVTGVGGTYQSAIFDDCVMTGAQIDAILLQYENNGLPDGVGNFLGASMGVPDKSPGSSYDNLISGIPGGWTIASN